MSESVGSCSSLGNSLTGSREDDVEVKSENTGGGVVLDAQIDVFINSESEVSYNLIINKRKKQQSPSNQTC